MLVMQLVSVLFSQSEVITSFKYKRIQARAGSNEMYFKRKKDIIIKV